MSFKDAVFISHVLKYLQISMGEQGGTTAPATSSSGGLEGDWKSLSFTHVEYPVGDEVSCGKNMEQGGDY